MGVQKTYGSLSFNGEVWEINNAQPHVCIKLKAVFPKIPLSGRQPFKFTNNEESCADLSWFIQRYPLAISEADARKLHRGNKKYAETINEMERILLPEYVGLEGDHSLREGYAGRHYQVQAKDVYLKTKRILIGDDISLGKTLIAILSFLHKETLPAIVVAQTHLPTQWAAMIEEFSTLKVHIIRTGEAYSLPPADVYIAKYSILRKWVNVFETGIFKSAVFDEAQELRRKESEKYKSARVLADCVKYCMGMTATPVYNYGDEIFNIIDLIKPGALGTENDFLREWTSHWSGNRAIVKDPQALGTYLRESFLFLRRDRADVGMELPPINRIVQTVGYDTHEVQKAEHLAKQLAIRVTSGSFMERGQAARELDMFLRQSTGVSKAREVAAYVRIFLENKEPVLLAGWHRDVYDIWLKELAEYNPMLYTGSESPAQKDRTKEAFINGETDLMIISLRSGIGLDGLQSRCKTVIFGELDWSPKVHEQVIGRIDRFGQENQVLAVYLVCDYGSDPVIIDLLGLKASQAHGIVNPLKAIPQTYTDESRIKVLANKFLADIEKRHNHNNLFS